MYESFGAVITRPSVTFKLFIPDVAVDPTQYRRGALPAIDSIQVIGTFQSALGQPDWDISQAPQMTKQPHPNGWLYTFTIPQLADGFYEYKYFVTFEDGTSRKVSDPCSKYDGSAAQNSAFVIGGNDMPVRPIAKRLPLSDLVIYELMVDDFTAEYRAARAPLDAVQDKLQYLQQLGVNAIEFMPWTAWDEDGFSWGYDPYAFFTVEHRYYDDPTAPLEKLFRLKRLVDAVHQQGMHVIMDGVFNHANTGQNPNRGFPYFWIYKHPEDSPYIGTFEDAAFFSDLDYGNNCTDQFITDVCRYWINDYKIDGIRFDYVRGFYDPQDPKAGITRIVSELQQEAKQQGLANISFTLEFLPDNRYEAVSATNRIAADGCWYDPLLWESFNATRGQLKTSYVRALNSGKDFDSVRRPVTYIENHDHSTATEQCGGRDAWWRTQPSAIALMTACGAPLIHNGQEFGEQYWFPEDGGGRVQARPLRWTRSSDAIGTAMRDLYRRLIAIRKQHPGLRSQNFYPEPYDMQLTRFNGEGYGVDEGRQLAVFHRWGTDEQGKVERFIVVLNFSDYPQQLDVPFPLNGNWTDLLSGDTATISDWVLRNHTVTSHWGKIYWRTD